MNLRLPVFVLAMASLAATFGTPYVLYEYECRGLDAQHCVYYTRCTYVGMQGWRRYFPAQFVPDRSRCAAIKLFPLTRPVFEWSAR